MDVTFTELPGVIKAGLAGRLDTATVNRVEPRFSAAVIPRGQPTIIDLSEVSFIASLGIRMLLTLGRSLGRSGARLAMFGAAPQVQEIIETTALSDIIPLFATEAEAIELVTA
jgi:anti-anti-sigma factor